MGQRGDSSPSLQPVSYDLPAPATHLHTPYPQAYYGLMSDDFDGDSGESEIPDDLTDDMEEKIQQAVDGRMGDIYEDSRPRSGGCLLILALPALSLWFLR